MQSFEWKSSIIDGQNNNLEELQYNISFLTNYCKAENPHIVITTR